LAVDKKAGISYYVHSIVTYLPGQNFGNDSGLWVRQGVRIFTDRKPFWLVVLGEHRYSQ